MAHSNALVRWLLPWIAVLFASATLAYAITSAIAGGSPVQEPGAAIGGSPTSVGVDWWIVAESQRNERGTYAVLDSPAATPTRELTNWNRIAVTTLVAFPPAASGAPPALQVNMGMVQGAVYDAVNAIEPRHRPYLLETRFASTASKGGCRGDRGTPRPLEHRVDRAGEHCLPEQGRSVAVPGHGV